MGACASVPKSMRAETTAAPLPENPKDEETTTGATAPEVTAVDEKKVNEEEDGEKKEEDGDVAKPKEDEKVAKDLNKSNSLGSFPDENEAAKEPVTDENSTETTSKKPEEAAQTDVKKPEEAKVEKHPVLETAALDAIEAEGLKPGAAKAEEHPVSNTDNKETVVAEADEKKST